MKSFVAEVLIISLLCFLELFKVASEPSSKQIRVDGKKFEQATMTDNLSKIHEQQLDAKSNCVKGSKVLRLLAKLGRGKDQCDFLLYMYVIESLA